MFHSTRLVNLTTRAGAARGGGGEGNYDIVAWGFVVLKRESKTRDSCPGELVSCAGMRHIGVGRGTGAWGLCGLKGVSWYGGEACRVPSAGPRGFGTVRDRDPLAGEVWRSPTGRGVQIYDSTGLSHAVGREIDMWVSQCLIMYCYASTWTANYGLAFSPKKKKRHIMQGYLEHSQNYWNEVIPFPCTTISESQIIAHGSPQKLGHPQSHEGLLLARRSSNRHERSPAVERSERVSA